MVALVRLPQGHRSVRLVAVPLALGISFLTLQTGIAFFLAKPATVDIALRVDSGSSWARTVAIDERLKGVQLGRDATALADYSRETLLRSPYNAVALRTIGIIRDSEDKQVEANRFISLAGRLSLRDYLTHAWLFSYRLQTNDFGAAVAEADILLRQQPENADQIVPPLVSVASDPRAIPPLAATLKTKPVWRSFYLARLGEVGKDPPATYRLLTRLKQIGSPATSDELFTYFVNSGPKVSPPLLYAQWLYLSPGGARARATPYLRDGDFAGLDAPPPFAWRLYPRDGVYAERETGPNGMGSSLFASYAGGADTLFANQQTLLPPGRYRLSGRAYVDQPVDPSAFQWSVVCAKKGREAMLAQLPIAAKPMAFAQYAIDFDVPAGCGEQQIAFTGTNVGEGFDRPSIHIDELGITRLSN